MTTDGYGGWVRELAAKRRFGDGDRLGTVNLIDAAARTRAADAMRTGNAVSLSRPLVGGHSVRDDGLPGYRLELFHDGPLMTGVEDLAVSSEHIQLDCHGVTNTHVDALNHLAFDDVWYGGFPAGGDEAGSVEHLAEAAIVTRAIHVDVPKLRGTEWVDPSRPVSGDDFEAAFEAAGVTFESGDALLIDMGRDRFHAAGQKWPRPGTPRPGVGADGARWIVENDVSVVCWDFIDAPIAGEFNLPVHALNWAIGQVLVDNCSFAALREHPATSAVGALTLAPLRAEGATGCAVNPLFVW